MHPASRKPTMGIQMKLNTTMMKLVAAFAVKSVNAGVAGDNAMLRFIQIAASRSNHMYADVFRAAWLSQYRECYANKETASNMATQAKGAFLYFHANKSVDVAEWSLASLYDAAKSDGLTQNEKGSGRKNKNKNKNKNKKRGPSEATQKEAEKLATKLRVMRKAVGKTVWELAITLA